MRRRMLTVLLALVPLLGTGGACAQNGRKIYRIGVMGFGVASELAGPHPANPFIDAFLRGLRDLGYVYGEHFTIEPRGSDGRPSEFRRLADELVGLRPDVIVAPGPMLGALKQATSTIPIVMAADGDPVGRGYAQSLRHPGRNFTGMSLQLVELTPKRLALLKELVSAQSPSRSRGIGPPLSTGKRPPRRPAKGVGRSCPSSCVASRLPAMYELRPYVEADGLISYGADLNEVWRHAAAFVQKILSGANPADLAIEQPTKLELVINARTARAMDIKIPRALLLQADRIIE